MRSINSATLFPPLLRTLVVAASAIIILAGMHAIASILNAFLLAVLIATICVPFENWLERKGMHHFVAFVVSFLVSLLIGIGAALFLALSILQVIKQLPNYQAQLEGYLNELTSLAASLGFSADTLGSAVSISADQIIQAIIAVLRSAGGIVGVIILTYFFLFYMLLDGKGIADRLHHRLGREDSFVIRATAFATNSRRYIFLRTILGGIIAAVQTVLMLVMGVDFALLWGALSFLCNYIPNIGFIIAIIPPASLMFLEQGLGPTIVFVVLYTISNNIVENYISPLFIGVHVNLSPLSVSLSIIFWAWVLGPLGAILGLPLTLFVKGVLLESDTSANAMIAMMSSMSDQKENPQTPVLIEDTRSVQP